MEKNIELAKSYLDAIANRNMAAAADNFLIRDDYENEIARIKNQIEDSGNVNEIQRLIAELRL